MDSSSFTSTSTSTSTSSSETFQAHNVGIVCQEIETLINELKKLRLPHKLKQYRIYRERIANIALMNNNGDGSLASEIEKLYVKLDSSVLCGVEQCFICAADQPKSFVNNANRINGECFPSSSLPSMAMAQLLNEFNGKIDNVDEDFKCLPIDLPSNNDNKNNNDIDNGNQNGANEFDHTNNSNNMNSSNVKQHLSPSDIFDENNSKNDDKNKISIIINKDKVQWNLPDPQWPPIPDEILQASPSIESAGNELKKNSSFIKKSTDKIQVLTETLSARPYRKFHLDNQLVNNGRLIATGNITSYKAYKNFINNYTNSASVMK